MRATLHLTVAGLFTILLVVSTIGILFSQFAALFGPMWGFLVGVVGFVLGLAGALYSERWFVKTCPQGLSVLFPALAVWRRISLVAASTVATIWFIAVVTLCLSSRLNGELTDAATPVFWPHAKYEQVDHLRITPISKLHYWTIASSFSVAWHSLALLLTIVALRGLLFGQRLEVTKDGYAKPHRSGLKDPD